jgi:hypothetical protein
MYSISGAILPSKHESTRDGLISFPISLKLLDLSSHESRLSNRTKLSIELMLSANHQDTLHSLFFSHSSVLPFRKARFLVRYTPLPLNQSKRISSGPQTIKWLAFTGSSILVQDENNTLCYFPGLFRSICLRIISDRCPGRYKRRFKSGRCAPQDHRR